MTLRSKILLYFVALHVLLAGVAVYVLMHNTPLLFLLEALFAVSVFISYRLVRALFVPLDLIRTGAELINERDFSSRFVDVGQPEMDSLIHIYNRMIETLREERLNAQEQHQLLERIVAASPSGIVICGFDGEVQQVNPAAEAMLTPDLLATLRTVAPGESRLLSHLGARRLKVWRTEFRDRGFAKSFYLLHELTEELRLSEKSAYEKLIRMMSHEVNNSVGAVRSLLESSLRYAPQVSEADRTDFTGALTVASSRVDSLNRFMAGFADVVRIPAPHRVSTKVGELLRRSAALLRPELDSRNIALDIDIPSDLTVALDPHQFEQVTLNVLRNAIESIGRDGELTVSLHGRTLTIADSGPGIAEEIRSDLFTPFFTTKPDGRGLGLTIVGEILTNHAFPYTLRNRPAGGAEFVIEL